MSINATRFRLSGFSSGLDTESIISGLMQVERSKYNSIYRKKTTSEWKLEAYTQINTKLSEFSNKYFSVLSSDNIISASAYTSYKANYTANNAFKVTGSSGIIPGNYNVTKVTMAQYATITGEDRQSRKTDVSGSGLAEYLTSEVTSEQMKLADGSAATAGTQLKDIAGFGFSDTVTDIKFTVNGKSVVLNGEMTVEQAVNEINTQANVDVADADRVTASFADGKLTLSGKSITLSNVEGTAFGEEGGFAGIGEGAQARKLSFSTADSLANIAANGGPNLLDANGKVSFSINDNTFEFDGTASLDDIMNAVNASGANAKMSIDETTGTLNVRSNTEGTELKIENISGELFTETTGITSQTVTKTVAVSTSDTIASAAEKMGIDLQTDANGKFSFKINGEEFSFDTNTTLASMMSTVNSSDANVKMYYSELTDSFSFASTTLGSNSKIELEGVDGSNAMEMFGISAGNASATGVDASVTINGETITRDTNNFTVDGMKFEITGNYEATGTDTGHAITFTQDTDSITNKVKAFINDYNTFIEELYNKTREEKFYDFYPLTEEEIDALDDDDEVEKWNEKAKSGLLRSDSVVMGLMSELRSAAYSIVGDTGMMAADIGITTTGKEGKLQLDEEKFKKALADNPDKVAEVMAGRSTATDKSQAYSESGFAARLNITMTNYRQNIRANQIQQHTQRIYEYAEQIIDIEAKLLTKEEALWAKYSSLETLMTNLNSQGDWLSSQLMNL